MFKSRLKKTMVIFYSVFLILVVSIIIMATMYISIDKKASTATKSSPSIINTSVETQKLTVDFSDWNATCDWNLVVLNSQNAIPKNYKLKLKPDKESQIDARISSYLNDMIQDADAQGIKLWVSSGYRSNERQKELFSNKVRKYMGQGYTREESETLADTIVAKPGTSEHNLGLAVDLNGVRDDFCDTKEFAWLNENAANYGFILRYDNHKQKVTGKIYEPWHFRFVGQEHAKKMKEKDLCLEEYVSLLISSQY